MLIDYSDSHTLEDQFVPDILIQLYIKQNALNFHSMEYLLPIYTKQSICNGAHFVSSNNFLMWLFHRYVVISYIIHYLDKDLRYTLVCQFLRQHSRHHHVLGQDYHRHDV